MLAGGLPSNVTTLLKNTYLLHLLLLTFPLVQNLWMPSYQNFDIRDHPFSTYCMQIPPPTLLYANFCMAYIGKVDGPLDSQQPIIVGRHMTPR